MTWTQRGGRWAKRWLTTIESPSAFDLARTLIVAGQLSRRGGERKVARDALERAGTLFGELGAPVWEARALAEMRRIPIRRGAPTELTPTEQRVADLAASGRTNRDVAKELFISPKTVEVNLARVYRKLGVTSRPNWVQSWRRERNEPQIIGKHLM